MPQIPAPASGEKRAPGGLGGEKVPQTGLSLEDQILEDNVGLTKAVKKFDSDKGLPLLHPRHLVDPPGRPFSEPPPRTQASGRAIS